MIPAAIYARYSTTNQLGSIDEQVRACRAFASARGYVVDDAHVFTDAARSGASTDRAGLQAMLVIASHRSPFRTILVDDQTRLTRDVWDLGAIFSGLARAGVRVIDVQTGRASDDPGARPMMAMTGIVADQARETGRYQTTRTMRDLALAGLPTGALIYGYRSVPDQGYRIDEDEAPIVRRVVRWSDEGRSDAWIASTLNAEGVPSLNDRTKRPERGQGRGWSTGAVRTLLGNRKYVGIWTYAETIAAGHKRREVNRETDPQRAPVTGDRPDLAIITDPADLAAWHRVQVRLAARKPGRPAGAGAAPGPRSILPGLFRCGTCGSMMSLSGGNKTRSLSCGPARKRGDAKAHGGYVAATKMQRGLLDEIKARLSGPVADEIAERAERAIADAARRAAERPAATKLEKALRAAEGRVAKLAGLLARVSDPEPLLAQLETEQAAVRTLRAELAAAASATGSPRTPPSRAAIRAALGSFLDSMEELAPERTNRILRDAIGEGGIVVTPSRLAWECAGSLRLGSLLPNGGYTGAEGTGTSPLG